MTLETGTEKSGCVFRFAPSPNGYLHRGHAFSALLNSRAAQTTGGRFLLRIEDIDTTRARPEFEAAIFEDLAWLGLSWEMPVVRQSDRLEAYRSALAELRKLGLLYPSFLSRAEIAVIVSERDSSGERWPRDPEGAPVYPGMERTWSEAKREAEMASGRAFSVRLDMARALAAAPSLSWREIAPCGTTQPSVVDANPGEWGDVVLGRKEIPASYHLAVTVDDAFQGVTHVVRGNDLRPATSVHRLLQWLLGAPEPAYFHHRLILDAVGRKLSKSRGSETIRARRASGESAEALIAGLPLLPVIAASSATP